MYIHTYMYTYIHTYIHTYIQVKGCFIAGLASEKMKEYVGASSWFSRGIALLRKRHSKTVLKTDKQYTGMCVCMLVCLCVYVYVYVR
jgi:hypothetical protein